MSSLKPSILAADATAGTADDTYELFATFELAPGSEPTENEDIGYTVICSDGAGANTSLHKVI